MRVHYHTFGCKANQYDTGRMRQALEARGSETTGDDLRVDVAPSLHGASGLVRGVLTGDGDHPCIDASRQMCPN